MPGMRRLWILVLPLLLLGACGEREEAASGRPGEVLRSRTLSGLPVRIALHAEDGAAGRAAADEALTEIGRVLGLLDPRDPKSELNRIAGGATGEDVRVGRDVWDALGLALDLARRTRGAYDPTRGPLQALWEAHRARGELPAEGAIAVALTRVGWEKVLLTPPSQSARFAVAGMRLDLGLVGHGFAAQAGWSVLGGRGFRQCLVQVGATVVAGRAFPGTKGWRVPLEDGPVLLLHDAAAVATGSSKPVLDLEGQAYGENVDPVTNLGTTEPKRAVVIALDAPGAAAFAVALTVVPREMGMEQATLTQGVEAWIRLQDGTVAQTSGFAARVAPAE